MGESNPTGGERAEPAVVMVVNDDPVQRRILCGAIEKDGHQVLPCESAAACLDLIRQRGAPDLIVTDPNMPGIDGWRFCRLLRSPEYKPLNHVPILVVSATFSGSDAQEITLDLGANDFLGVPVEPTALRGHVEALLRGEVARRTATVLIVDDGLVHARLLQQAFQSRGYRALVAGTGAEARRRFAEARPDLVIQDYHLPDLSGETLLREYKAPGSHAVVIMATADPTPELATRWMEMGADAYLRKPFDIEYLMTTCEKAARGRALLRVEELLDLRAAELRESDERYRALVESARDGFYLIDLATAKIVFVNGRIAEMFGYRPEEGIGRDATDFIAPEDRARVLLKLNEQRSGKHVSAFRFKALRKDGSVFVAEISPSLVSYRGAPCSQGIMRDVTDHQRAEDALRQSEALLRTVLQAAPIGIGLTRRRVVEWVNEPLCRMMGYRADELCGRNTRVFYEDEADYRRIGELHQAPPPDGVYVAEVRLRRKDGRLVHALTTSAPLDPADPQAAMVFAVMDVSEMRRAEQSLELLGTAIDQAGEAVLITDTDGNIQYANPAFERITGYSPHEILGKNPRFLKSGRHDNAFYRRLWETITSGRVWQGHFVNKRKDGALYEEDATISPVRDAAGRIVNFVAVKQDVTRQRELEAQLRHSAKMEAVGQLAGGIAHDFNNLLTGILGYASVLKTQSDPGSPVHDAARTIETAAQRAADLTRQLLGFARKGKYQVLPVDMHRLVEETTRLLERSIDKRIRIVRDLKAAMPRVLGDPGQMQQVLLNLALNAADAMPDGGTLTIATELLSPGERREGVAVDEEGRTRLLLTVRDTGAGIPPDIRERIFEPFFTTKKDGRGTGMGLATAYGIVRNHGGTIGFASEKEMGTSFHVCLPAVAGEEDAASASPGETPTPAPRSGRILLVDDEEVVRDVGAAMLSGLGYVVVAAASGAEAIEYYRRHAAETDLVILDLVMPGMDGGETFEALQRINPRVRAVLTTGYGHSARTAAILDRGLSGFIQKPYRLAELAEAVEQALGRAP